MPSGSQPPRTPGLSLHPRDFNRWGWGLAGASGLAALLATMAGAMLLGADRRMLTAIAGLTAGGVFVGGMAVLGRAGLRITEPPPMPENNSPAPAAILVPLRFTRRRSVAVRVGLAAVSGAVAAGALVGIVVVSGWFYVGTAALFTAAALAHVIDLRGRLVHVTFGRDVDVRTLLTEDRFAWSQVRALELRPRGTGMTMRLATPRRTYRMDLGPLETDLLTQRLEAQATSS